MNNIQHPALLSQIEAFLADNPMGETYFGKKAVGNSELIARLRAGRFVSPATEKKVRSFIHDASRRSPDPRQSSVGGGV
jgi:hypothetical protein